MLVENPSKELLLGGFWAGEISKFFMLDVPMVEVVPTEDGFAARRHDDGLEEWIRYKRNQGEKITRPSEYRKNLCRLFFRLVNAQLSDAVVEAKLFCMGHTAILTEAVRSRPWEDDGGRISRGLKVVASPGKPVNERMHQVKGEDLLRIIDRAPPEFTFAYADEIAVCIRRFLRLRDEIILD